MTDTIIEEEVKQDEVKQEEVKQEEVATHIHNTTNTENTLEENKMR